MTTIITLVVIVSLGIVLVDGECQTNGGPIDNCCCLGYRNGNFNTKSSGVYTIGNFCGVKCSNTRVYCDNTSGGGGWTVIQRRQDGSVEFEKRDWVEYEDGFGSLHGEFWLGLTYLHCMTKNEKWELRIDYHLTNGTKSYLHYKQFAVGPAEDQYPLSISGFDSIGLTDPFSVAGSPLNGMLFTTRDRDNDLDFRSVGCAPGNGAWWYNKCHKNMELNDSYSDMQIFVNNEWLKLIFAEIKIKPQHCEQNA